MNNLRAILSFLILLFVVACNSPSEKNPNIPEKAINPDVIENPASASGNHASHVPVFAFQDSIHDFGKIIEGEKVSFAFRFKNTGNGDLLIRAANGSCGCTVPEFPKDPVAPGGSGVINVTFNSEGREGIQHKTVTIIANTIPNTTILSISAQVEPSK